MPLTFEQRLWLALAREVYGRRGEGFREDWSFHLHAAHHNLGAPLARSLPGSQALQVGGARYIVQPFARDVLYYEFPQYAQVQQLNAVLPNLSPAVDIASLPYHVGECAFRRSIDATSGFSAGARTLHSDWTFHQIAIEQQLGMALSPNYTIQRGTVALQVFAGDTLFSRNSPFRDFERLSQLAPNDPLYDSLWQQTYRVAGTTYNPQSPFHQEAVRLGLGTPLSEVYQITFDGALIMLQIFAYETLYAFMSGPLLRWSALPMIDAVQQYMLPAPPVIPNAGFVPDTRLQSLWLANNPGAPAATRALIETALRMLGDDQGALALLTPQQRTQMDGTGNIVCADLAAIALRAAGLSLNWVVTEPFGTIFTNTRAANYYRPHIGRMDIVPNNAILQPGDLFIYEGPTFNEVPKKWKPGEFHHVLIYVGHYAGQDRTGRSYDQNKGYCVVSANIDSNVINGYDEPRARTAAIMGYRTVTVVRPAGLP
jgi:hypothetical protein